MDQTNNEKGLNMKPTTERLRQAVSAVEVRLDLLGSNRPIRTPNVDAAIQILEELKADLAVDEDTPVEMLGLHFETVEALLDLNIQTAEQLLIVLDKKPDKVMNARRIGVERFLEIEECVEMWRKCPTRKV